VWEENKEIIEGEVGEALGEGVGIGIWHVREYWDLTFDRVEIRKGCCKNLLKKWDWFVAIEESKEKPNLEELQKRDSKDER